MYDKEVTPGQTFTKTVVINATPLAVWAALTEPALMNCWMSETEINIVTDWKAGSPIRMYGDWYKTGFENKGVVLQSEVGSVLEYSHLSSLSRLADGPENYSVIRFDLAAVEGSTSVTVALSNFPTETIYKHLAFYWNVAIELLKKFVER